MMLGDGMHRRIVASTLSEIRGSLDLVKEGKLDEVSHVNYASIKEYQLKTISVSLRSTRLSQRSPLP